MKTSLIITSYHADPEMLKLTKDCLASLVHGRPDEVILVDDGSPIKFKPQTIIDHFIYREENGGFPKCANTGMKHATGDVLIISNNDIVYNPGWLEGILKPLNEGYDISSIRVSDADGYLTEDKVTEGDKFGSLWAMRRKVYDKLGGFDEGFTKGTHEDLDYMERALKAGFRVGKNHGAMVEHVGRATMDKIYPNQEDYEEGREKFINKWGYIK